MNRNDLFRGFNGIDPDILERSERTAVERRRTKDRLKWVGAAACLALMLAAVLAALPGRTPGAALPPGSGAAAPVSSDGGSRPTTSAPTVSSGDNQPATSAPTTPAPTTGSTAAPSGSDTPRPSGEYATAIGRVSVTVNESGGAAPNAARRYYDPAHYDSERWDEDKIRAYFGWALAPDDIPGGITDNGRPLSGTVIRSRETGKLVQDQMGRGYWSGYHEDGSPKSTDGLYIPTGFTVTASKLGIIRCGLLPAEEITVSDFAGVPVTLIHCAMPHGPYDPDSYAPNGLYHTPAGYYDVYQATFTVKGVSYEIAAQRMALEEVVRVTASVIGSAGR